MAHITGYIEALTPAGLVGWAWDADAPGQRLRIQARQGDDVVAETIADRPRDDLAANGIGDGHHAFVLELPASDGQGLRVFAVGPDGEQPLGRAPSSGAPPSWEQIQRGLEGVLSNHRQALQQDNAQSLALINDGLAQLEACCARIEARLGPTAAPPKPPAQTFHYGLAIVAAGVIFTISVTALVLSVIRVS